MAASQILVTGATGSTGREIVRALQHTDHSVRAMVHREDARADTLRELGAEIVMGDLLDVDSVLGALEGIDSAYFVYPIVPGILEATAYFAQAAQEAGVGAIVNMSQGTCRRDSKSHASQNHWMSQQVLDWAEVPVTHIRPNLFAEWLLYPFTLWPLVGDDILTLPFGEAHFAPLTAFDQGRVIATILADPAAHAGKIYQLDGPTDMDGTAIAAALTEVLKRTIRYAPMTIEEFNAFVIPIPILGEFFAQHIGGVIDDLKSGLWVSKTNTVEELTGTPPMDLKDFIREHLDEFASTKAPATAT
ncbi:SDR family oxidoreductase [soil metagenome]